MILFPQILLYHVISKSVPITESYSKTIGLLRRNGSTVESLRKKISKEKKVSRGWEWRVKNKTNKNTAVKGMGIWNEGQVGNGIWKKKKAQYSSFLQHYHLKITSLTWQEVQKKWGWNSLQIWKWKKKIRSMENGPSWHHNAWILQSVLQAEVLQTPYYIPRL